MLDVIIASEHVKDGLQTCGVSDHVFIVTLADALAHYGEDGAQILAQLRLAGSPAAQMHL